MVSSPSQTATAKSLLSKAMNRLAKRDFISCQKLAAEALASDQGLASAAVGILSVAGVLLSGGDLYAVLDLSRAEADDSNLVWARFERLAETLARPELNDVAFAQEAYDLALEAWTVLSDPQRKSRYDAAAASFWTLCPYCFWLFQYGKAYEECCLRCQNCSRAFHGVAIAEPPPETIVPGKDQYFLCRAIFPLAYKPLLNANVTANANAGASANVNVNVNGSANANPSASASASASANADADECNGDSIGSGLGGGGESAKRKRATKVRAGRVWNVKAVAKKKKGMGSLSDCQESESEKEREKESNNGDGGDLVFYERDGDVFVGLEDIIS